jgi:hypothetical protein
MVLSPKREPISLEYGNLSRIVAKASPISAVLSLKYGDTFPAVSSSPLHCERPTACATRDLDARELRHQQGTYEFQTP